MKTERGDFDAQLTRAFQPLTNHQASGPGREAALQRASRAWVEAAGRTTDRRPRFGWLAAPATCLLLALLLWQWRQTQPDPAAAAPGHEGLSSTSAIALVFDCKSEQQAQETRLRLQQTIDQLDETQQQDFRGSARVALLLDNGQATGAAILLDQHSANYSRELRKALSASSDLGRSFETRAMVYRPAEGGENDILSASLLEGQPHETAEPPMCIAWPSSMSMPDNASLKQAGPATPVAGPAATDHQTKSAKEPETLAPPPQLLGIRPYGPAGERSLHDAAVLDDSLKTYLGLPQRYWDCQILVEEVLPGSPAGLGGLRKGDMLLSAEHFDAAGKVKQPDKELQELEDLKQILMQANCGEQIEFTVLRSAALLRVRVCLADKSSGQIEGYL